MKSFQEIEITVYRGVKDRIGHLSTLHRTAFVLGCRAKTADKDVAAASNDKRYLFTNSFCR